MSKKFRVCQVNDDTIRETEDLLKEAFHDEGWTHADIHKFAGKTGNVAKVLLYRNRVLGCLFYTIAAKECRIRRLAVFKRRQRRGYGRLLVKTLTGEASPLRRPKITAYVREDRLTSLQFFRDSKLGFVFDPKAPRRIQERGLEGYLFAFHKKLRPLRTIRRERKRL